MLNYGLVWRFVAIFSIYDVKSTISITPITAVELVKLWFHLSNWLPVLHLCPDIANPPKQECIYFGTQWNYHINNSIAINSIWSTTRHPLRNSGRKADRGVFECSARLANISITNECSDVRVRLFNIWSLTDKGHLLQDLMFDRKHNFLSLTETCQNPNEVSQ